MKSHNGFADQSQVCREKKERKSKLAFLLCIFSIFQVVLASQNLPLVSPPRSLFDIFGASRRFQHRQVDPGAKARGNDGKRLSGVKILQLLDWRSFSLSQTHLDPFSRHILILFPNTSLIPRAGYSPFIPSRQSQSTQPRGNE